MSLVGSLEDLGLGDILQIVHLAGKSGVLRLRGESGEGQIVFKRGMIHEAYAKGGPTDLRELLAGRRVVPAPLLERAWLEAHHAGRRLADVLAERGLVSGEAIDALRREQIEGAVLAMFGWPSGEFSFEMRDVGDEGAELALDSGMNPQFLALEGTRRADERSHGQAVDAEPEAGPQDPFGALLEVELLDEEGAGDALDEPSEPLAPLASPEAEAAPEPPAPPQPAVCAAPPPVVVIDPSLPALEWAKAALGAVFPRVHVFQRPGLGIERIRQYLSRVELPLVLIAHDVPPDPATGARDAGEIAARLKRQAPGMTVLLLHDEGSEPRRFARRPAPDGCVPRPPAAVLEDPRAARQRMHVASALQEALEGLLARPERAPGRRPPAEELGHLRETSARIREGAGRGEVLSQVLSFAAQRFARVALFGVRDERAVGVAQVGLARAGGPDEAALRELSLGSAEPAWFRRVIESRRPAAAPPSDEGDHRLAVLLGNDIPAEAWVAPIVTGERVVALLYCDNLPGRDPIPDTRSLEVLLDAAGIALDRAVLERTLAESETADPETR
jgi:hypothetical protein